MKKSLIILLAVITALALSGCRKVGFDGTGVKNDDVYSLTFDVLNISDDHVFTLGEGDELDVLIKRKSGGISLRVTGPDKTVVYRGDNVESGAFRLGISEAGEYTCSISGKDGAGSVSFSVLRAADEQ